MDSIEVLLKQSDSYAVFSKDASRHIKSVLEGRSLQQVVHGRNRSKVQFAVDLASEGVAALLYRRPDRLAVLVKCAPDSLPLALRTQVWTMRLREWQRMNDTSSAGQLRVSPADASIWANCLRLLVPLGLAVHVDPLKRVLSHLHAQHLSAEQASAADGVPDGGDVHRGGAAPEAT